MAQLEGWRITRAIATGAPVGPEEPGDTTVSGADLARFLATAADPHHRGLTLVDVTVEGEIDLDDATVPFPVELRRCTLAGGISVRRSRLRSLTLDSCTVAGVGDDTEAVRGEGVQLAESLSATDSTFAGAIGLAGASVTGSVGMERCGVQGRLDLSRSEVHGSVLLSETTVDDWLSLFLAHVHGTVAVMEASRVGATETGRSLLGDGATIDGGLMLTGPDTALDGALRLHNATVRGQLRVADGATVAADPSGLSIDADQARTHGHLMVEGVGTVLAGALQISDGLVGGRLIVRAGATVGADRTGTSLQAAATRITNGLYVEGPDTSLAGLMILDGAEAASLGIRAGASVGADPTGCSLLASRFVTAGHFTVEGAGTVLAGQIFLLDARVGGLLMVSSGARVGADEEGTSLFGDRLSTSGSLFVQGEGTELVGAVRLGDATLGSQLAVRGGATVGASVRGFSIEASGVSTRADLRVDGPTTALAGALMMSGADVGGVISLGPTVRIGAVDGLSVLADRVHAGAGLFIEADTVLDGALRAYGTVLGGQLSVRDGARLGADGQGASIDAYRLTTRDDVHVRSPGTVLAGCVCLRDATIEGMVDIWDGASVGADDLGRSLDADGLRTSGSLDVEGEGTTLAGSLRLRGARLGGPLEVRDGAAVGADGEGLSLDADRMRTDGHLMVTGPGTALDGALRINGATVEGRLTIRDGATVGATPASEDGIRAEEGSGLLTPCASLDAGGLATAGLVVLGEGTALAGLLAIPGATLGGPLRIDGAAVGDGGSGTSLDASEASLRRVTVRDARLAGGLGLAHASMRHVAITGVSIGAGSGDDLDAPGPAAALALDLTHAEVDLLHVGPIAGPGAVVLDDAAVRHLQDTPATWAGEGRTWSLDGFDPGGITGTAAFPLDDRLRWLAGTGIGGDVPAGRATYRRVAKALADGGDDDAAVTVLESMRKAHNPRWLRILLSPIGQGYRPVRALWFLLAVVLLAGASVWIGQQRGLFVAGQDLGQPSPTRPPTLLRSDDCDRNTYPCVRVVAYTADLILPVVASNDTEYWRPESSFPGSVDWFSTWLVLLRLAGWGFGGLFLIGVLNTVLEEQRT